MRKIGKTLSSQSESSVPFEPGDIFPERDPLAGATATDVGPEIAAALGIPASSVPLDGWTEPEPLATSIPDVMPFDLALMPESFRPLVKDVAEANRRFRWTSPPSQQLPHWRA